MWELTTKKTFLNESKFDCRVVPVRKQNFEINGNKWNVIGIKVISEYLRFIIILAINFLMWFYIYYPELWINVKGSSDLQCFACFQFLLFLAEIVKLKNCFNLITILPSFCYKSKYKKKRRRRRSIILQPLNIYHCKLYKIRWYNAFKCHIIHPVYFFISICNFQRNLERRLIITFWQFIYIKVI